MKVKIFSLLLAAATFMTGVMLVGTLRMIALEQPQRAMSIIDAKQTSESRSAQFTELPSKLELSCYDPTLLPIWSELKRDAVFQDVLARFSGQYDCSELLDVERRNFNGAGADEFLVRGKNLLCGATGNCYLWVFGERNGRMTLLLHSDGRGARPRFSNF